MTATLPRSAALQRILSRLACPACRAGLRADGADLACEGCGRRYQVHGDMPVLLDEASAAEIQAARGGAENVALRSKLGRMARLADIIRPPHPFLFINGRACREAFSAMAANGGPDAVVLDIGSGLLKGLNASGLSQHVRDHLVPLDVPFLQHYHLDPLDFRRYTVYGFEQLFGRFEKVRSGVAAGPASALADLLTEFPALPFRSPALYWGVKLISGWLVSPLRFLDGIWGRVERAHIASGAVYFLGRKPA